MKKLLPILLLIGCLFASCEKESSTYPKKYVRASFVPGSLKMFTNTGEVTDENTIKQFIADKEESFWNASIEPEGYWNFEVKIVSEDSAKIIYNDTVVTMYGIIQQDGILYFQQKDTISVHRNPILSQFKYAPLFAEINDQDVSSIITRYVPCKFVKEINGELVFPFVTFKEKISSDYLTNVTTCFNFNNEINPTYSTSIISDTKTDTIVYQENQLVFKLQ